MKTKLNTCMARVFAVVMAICLVAGFMLPSVDAASDSVSGCASGVLQVNLVYTDDNNDSFKVQTGTGFLVNDTTLVTCNHVVSLSNEDLETLAAAYNKTIAEVKSRLSVTITVIGDTTIPATISSNSVGMDFAVIRMSQALGGTTPLTLRSSAEVIQAENVWAIGFPTTSALLEHYSSYTNADVTVTNGIVNKIVTGENPFTGETVTSLQTSCNLSEGNSGGPMVDDNGYVVGVCQGVVTDSTTSYFNAIAIDQIIGALNKLNVTYNLAGSTPEPTPTEAPAVVATEPPVVATQAPATEAATLPPVDDDGGNTGTDTPAGSNMTLILIIAAVAVVIIVVVVVVILAGGKKKAPVAPPVAPPVPPVRPVTPPPTYPVVSNETTVLNGNAGETTVLSRSAVSGGTLIRKRTGETVSINTAQFVVGRERKDTNYCIADNSSISRKHIRIEVRGGTAYLTDLGAANGTFVNGVKVMPRQEVALKNGDKITLADEDLEYKN